MVVNKQLQLSLVNGATKWNLSISTFSQQMFKYHMGIEVVESLGENKNLSNHQLKEDLRIEWKYTQEV